jgi:elongation factor P
MHVPVKRGALLRHRGHLYFVEDLAERHTGQQRPTIHLKLRSAEDGRHIERTIDEIQPLEEVPAGYRMAQYLYAKGAAHVFMDSQSFEEVELSGPALAGREAFLKAGQEFRILYADGKPLHLDMPDNVTLRVANTAVPSHGVGGAANILKEAVLENGLTVRVPMFIKTGDTISINTRTKEYLGKA